MLLNNSHLVEKWKPAEEMINAVNEVLKVASLSSDRTQPYTFTSTCNVIHVTTDFSSSWHLNKVDNHIKHDRETETDGRT